MAINLTGNSRHIDRSCVVRGILRFSRKFQTSHDMIINFHITSFSSNRLKYMRPRYYEDSREFERTGRFLPRTIRKSCELGEKSLARIAGRTRAMPEKATGRTGASQKFDPARLLDESLLLVFLRTQRKSILSKKRGTLPCVRAAKSVVASKFARNRYIFRRLSATWHYDQRCDLRTRQGEETSKRTNDFKRAGSNKHLADYEKQLTHIFGCLVLLSWYTIHILIKSRHRGFLA